MSDLEDQGASNRSARKGHKKSKKKEKRGRSPLYEDELQNSPPVQDKIVSDQQGDTFDIVSPNHKKQNKKSSKKSKSKKSQESSAVSEQSEPDT